MENAHIKYKIPLLYYLKRNKGTRSLKISTNKIYAGLHWGQRKSIKDRILDTTGRFCSPIKIVQSYPVEISYRFFFSSRPLDTLNTAYMSKMLEDAFRSLGILKDDDPSHVAKSILEVIALPKEKRPKKRDDQGKKVDAKDKDYVEIIISPYVKSESKLEGSAWRNDENVIPAQ